MNGGTDDPREFRTDGWDETLRDAKTQNEALVVRGSASRNDFELEPVVLRPEAVDPFADACARAFDDEGYGADMAD